METERQFAQKVKAQSARLAETWPAGSKMETDLIAHWRRHSPKMVANLDRLGMTAALAHLLVHRCIDQEMTYRRAGWSAGDASAQAAMDHLMMEPEEPEAAPEPRLLAELWEEIERSRQMVAAARAGTPLPEEPAPT